MLFASSTDVFSSLGFISTDIFSGFSTYIAVILGIILAFYIMERLITAIFPKKYYGGEIEVLDKKP